MKESIFLLTIIGIISLSECWPYYWGPGSKCKTQDGRSGICRYLMNCVTLVQQYKWDDPKPQSEIIDALMKTRCILDYNAPIVCCTEPRIPLVDYIGYPAHIPYDQYSRMLRFQNCGFSNTSHVKELEKAQTSVLGAWPWAALLGYRRLKITSKADADIKYFCGATLVSEKHLISSAFCITYSTSILTVARLGDLYLDEGITDHASPVDYVVQTARAHPDYNESTGLNDISIIYLEEKVQFTNVISPICLPKLYNLRNSDFQGTKPYLAGWGFVNLFRKRAAAELLEIQISVLPDVVCRAALSYRINRELTSKEICAGFRSGGREGCTGDTGGALMLLSPEVKRYYLIGIAANSRYCAMQGTPSLYTRTNQYLDWLQDNLV